MVFGMKGSKPSNPLDSKVVGAFNFTDYGLVYASAAELKATRVLLFIIFMIYLNHM